jgi:5-methylcytosine-specific restriction endonuclease McrA
MEITLMQKPCSTCKVVKDISEFSCDCATKDGVRCRCRACDALYYEEHKVQINEYREEHKKGIARRQREYRKNHKNEIARQGREYCKEHKVKIVEYRRVYQQTDKYKLIHKMDTQRRRALKKNSEVTFTVEQWNYIITIQKNRCNKCDRKFTKHRPPTMDHIIPLSRGGSFTSDNVQALCGSCNSSKCAKLDLQYIQVWII